MKISNQTFNLLIMGVFCIVFFGCAALKPSQVTKNDCALVFPRTDDYEKLTSPDGQPYYEAWERGFADDVDEAFVSRDA